MDQGAQVKQATATSAAPAQRSAAHIAPADTSVLPVGTSILSSGLRAPSVPDFPASRTTVVRISR